jgi:hypothetical protein
MIQRFAALPRCRDQNGQILLDLVLPDQVIELLWTQGVIDAVIRLGFGVKGTIFGVRHKEDYKGGRMNYEGNPPAIKQSPVALAPCR